MWTLVRPYYQNTRGLIFVVDSNDRDHLEKARENLHTMLTEVDLRVVPLLVYANKQDIEGAMSQHQITEYLGLAEVKDRKWRVQPCEAVNGEGLHVGLNWLTENLQTDAT